MGTRSGEVVTALASHLRGQGLHHTWVDFVVVSLLFSEKFFPGYSRFLFLFFCFATLLWHSSNKLQESIRIWQESPKKPWGLSRPSTQNPTFLKFQFNQEWYVAVLILNLYFTYSLIYVCNMYVLKLEKWVNSQLMSYMYYGDSIFTLTFTQVIKTSGSNAVVSQYLARMFINWLNLSGTWLLGM